MLHAAVLRSPHAHARVKKISLERALAAPGVRGAVGPGDVDALTDEPGHEGQAVAAVAADTIEQARAAVELIDVEWDVSEAAARPRRGRGPGAAHRRARAATSAATSTGRSPRRTSSSRPSTARRPSSTARSRRISRCASGAATRSTSTSRRSSSGASATRSPGKLGLPPDKVRVVCEFMGGGFGSKNGAGDYTFIAIELAKRTGRPVRCALTRREENLATGNRNATIQRLTAAAQGRRDAARARRRVRERDRLGRLGRADRRPDAAALRLRERAHRPLPGEDQHAADEGVPRARLRRGDVRARVPARRARGEARPRLARAAAPQLRELVRRQAVLVEEPDGVLPPRRAALAAARPGARAERGAVEARRRPREPDLVRRRRSALVRLGAARLRRARDRDHGDAGHRHRHGDGDEPDRGRGARASARQGRSRSRRLRPRAVRVDLRRLVDDAVDGPGRSRRRRGRGAPGARDRGAALRPGGARALADGRQRRLVGRRVVAARGGRGAARGRADPRQGRARPEPDRDAGADVRRPGRRGRRRRRDGRDPRRARRRDPRRRPRDQPARARRARSRAGSSRASGTRSRRTACSIPRAA